MTSTAMEAAFRYLAEEIRQEMRGEMMKVVERAATSCASICMDRMQALRAELLAEFEEAAETKGASGAAANEVRRRTSFYELYTDDAEMKSGSEGEADDGGEDLAKLYDHLEKCARRRSSTNIPSMPSSLPQGPAVPPSESLRGQVFGTDEPDPLREGSRSFFSNLQINRRRSSQSSVEEELIALDDFLKAAQPTPSKVQEASQSVEDRVSFLEFFLYPAAAPKTKASLTLDQRVDLLDGHLWGSEADLFEVLELGQRVRLAERALLGVARV